MHIKRVRNGECAVDVRGRAGTSKTWAKPASRPLGSMTATQEPTIFHPSKTRRFLSRWNSYKARCIVYREIVRTRCHFAWISSKVKPILAWYFTRNAGTGGGFPERDPAVRRCSAVPAGCAGNRNVPSETGAARAAAFGGASEGTAYSNLLTHKANQNMEHEQPAGMK